MELLSMQGKTCSRDTSLPWLDPRPNNASHFSCSKDMFKHRENWYLIIDATETFFFFKTCVEVVAAEGERGYKKSLMSCHNLPACDKHTGEVTDSGCPEHCYRDGCHCRFSDAWNNWKNHYAGTLPGHYNGNR